MRFDVLPRGSENAASSSNLSSVRSDHSAGQVIELDHAWDFPTAAPRLLLVYDQTHGGRHHVGAMSSSVWESKGLEPVGYRDADDLKAKVRAWLLSLKVN